jgi:glucose/arabinose dehydrogenase
MATHAIATTPATEGAAVRSGRFWWFKYLLVALLLGAAGGWFARGKILIAVGLREKPTYCTELSVTEIQFWSITPVEQSGNHPINKPVRAEAMLPDGVKIDPASINADNVALRRVRGDMKVDATVALDDTGRTIVVTPKQPLEPQTNYWFGLSNGIMDTTGTPISPYQVAFDTAPTKTLDLPAFEQIVLDDTQGLGITCVTVQYGKLWASVDDGRILRWSINPDGTLGVRETFTALVNHFEGEPRLIGGFCFDPSSTAEQPILWVTHTKFGFVNVGNWHGKLARISGEKLDKIDDIITNLPRSARDHVIHQPSFGPDGALYFQSGSMNSYGDPDGFWGMRPENPFSAVIVRVDTRNLPAKLPIDVKTPHDGGTYDWKNPNLPVQVWAYGIRVVYDLNWHSNGHMYAPTNGSCAGGNAPASDHSVAIKNLPDAEHDWLFRVEKGKYYGHPNPSQGFYVLNGGNPTPGADYAEVPHYPVGTKPEKDWQGAIYSFGNHVSANGSAEYFTPGPLQHTLIVCRYNMGSDLIALKFDEKGDVAEVIDGVEGWENLQNPLDVCEDRATGNLYVSEYGRHAITLLRRK